MILDEKCPTPQTLESSLASILESVPAAAGKLGASLAAGLDKSRTLLEQSLAAGRPVYGSNTGYGPFVEFAAEDDKGEDLITHLLAGSGSPLPGNIVMGAMYLRAWTMSRGKSGVRLPVIQAYLDALKHCSGENGEQFYPFIPSVGSLGASGDLVPLAHLLNAILGRGQWFRHKVGMSAGSLSAGSPKQSFLGSHTLDRREALACINGISFSKATASLAYCRLERLLRIQELLTASVFALLDANPEHLHPSLFQSSTTGNSARRIREALSHVLGLPNSPNSPDGPGAVDSMDMAARDAYYSELLKTSGPHSTDPARERTGYGLQAPYSLRCAPQLLGACNQALESGLASLMQDLETVDDNPILDPDSGTIAHGGNFFGQPTAFASDQMTMVATQIGVLAERQLALLLEPEINGEAGLMLAEKPGADSGLAGVQLTATALVAELRSLAQMHSTFSIPTNGKNQDVVPMSLLAARKALESTERLAALLGAELLAIRKLWSFRARRGRMTGERPIPRAGPMLETGRTGDFPFWSDSVLEDLGSRTVAWGPVSALEANPTGSFGKKLSLYQCAFLSKDVLTHENLYSGH
ncbi:MAG: hypothetical protein CMN76_06150 [Spirochaetaceae bacterium]|nr:hypothetical protein [Spirochaetaceae bacterium]|tara:strand:+ start:266983 stop:268737 length:1755 start_codon:yes stop_codon:yes gene_type:complete